MKVVTCPSKNCIGRFFINAQSNFFTCPLCNNKYCAECNHEFHPMVQCDEVGLSEEERQI